MKRCAEQCALQLYRTPQSKVPKYYDQDCRFKSYIYAAIIIRNGDHYGHDAICVLDLKILEPSFLHLFFFFFLYCIPRNECSALHGIIPNSNKCVWFASTFSCIWQNLNKIAKLALICFSWLCPFITVAVQLALPCFS